MKRFMLLILSFFAFANLGNFAQAQGARPGESDPQAVNLLNAAVNAYNEAGGIHASFVASVLNTGTREVLSRDTGTIIIKGEKYIFEASDYTRACDEKSVWTYFKPEEEVQIVEYDPNDGEISPAWLASLDIADFTVIFSNDETNKLELVPNDKTLSYAKIKLRVNADNIVELIEVFEKTGTRYIYNLTNITLSSKTSDSVFEVDFDNLPDDVEISDLRP